MRNSSPSALEPHVFTSTTGISKDILSDASPKQTEVCRVASGFISFSLVASWPLELLPGTNNYDTEDGGVSHLEPCVHTSRITTHNLLE